MRYFYIFGKIINYKPKICTSMSNFFPFLYFFIFIQVFFEPNELAMAEEHSEHNKIIITNKAIKSTRFKQFDLFQYSVSYWDGDIIKFFSFIASDSQPMAKESTGKETNSAITDRIIFDYIEQKFNHYGFLFIGPHGFIVRLRSNALLGLVILFDPRKSFYGRILRT